MSSGLTFEPVTEPPEQNRLFIIIAIGLVGMLVLGLLGIGGYVVFSRSRRASQAQQVIQSTPVVLLATSTPTVMATPTSLPTLAPTRPTNTPVVLQTTPTAVIVVVQPTATLASEFFRAAPPSPDDSGDAEPMLGGTTEGAAEEPQPPAAAQPDVTKTPDTGFGLGALGLGAGLAAVVFVARRLRLHD